MERGPCRFQGFIAGIWAHNLLVARRAKADGTLDRGEAEHNEDVKGPREDDNANKDEQLQENKEAPAKKLELAFKNYDGQMVRELRGLCRARGLPSNGIKAELKAALAKDDEERGRQRANVKLFKADGTELDLDGKLPLDAGSSSKSPVRVEGAPSSEFQAQVEARDLSQLGAQEVKDLEQSLPEQKLIDLERPIAESLSHIKKYTDEKDTLTTRVPPTCAIRCARGKKSTFLVELFNRLKRPQWPTALWVTFNGFTEVPKQVQESSFHWLCRTLAHAVALPSAKAALANGSCSCSEQVLAAYFSGQQDFVLLVDEMNFLLTGEDPEADERAAMFLKQHFLSATGLICPIHQPQRKPGFTW